MSNFNNAPNYSAPPESLQLNFKSLLLRGGKWREGARRGRGRKGRRREGEREGERVMLPSMAKEQILTVNP